jgi:hypothetical protein
MDQFGAQRNQHRTDEPGLVGLLSLLSGLNILLTVPDDSAGTRIRLREMAGVACHRYSEQYHADGPAALLFMDQFGAQRNQHRTDERLLSGLNILLTVPDDSAGTRIRLREMAGVLADGR